MTGCSRRAAKGGGALDPEHAAGAVTLFLCGDVMTGRGLDQIMRYPGRPEVYEPCVKDARDYVALAEHASGPIPRGVEPAYIWGEALDELTRVAPDARIINLETSITTSEEAWPGKGINYRMHPRNVACLTAARVDVCVLANNHVLDYGFAGLEETLETLARSGISSAGAGRDLSEARRPAELDLPGGRRVLVFAFADRSSGVPEDWRATSQGPGIDLLEDLSDSAADEVLERVTRVRRPGDVVVASIHWGGNWGYRVPRAQVRFARRLVDGGVDLVHGHSSHHPRPLERYRGRLILYGCGDFLNDYEGIGGYEEYRSDLVLMYFPGLDPRTGELLGLTLTPMRVRRMRLNRATPEEAAWLRDSLNRVSAGFGTGLELAADARLVFC